MKLIRADYELQKMTVANSRNSIIDVSRYGPIKTHPDLCTV